MGLTQQDIDEISIAFDINGAKNNVEIREAFQKILDSGSGSSTGFYATRITQLSVLPPVAASPAANTTGVVPVWGRTGTGVYTLTFTGFTTLTNNNVIPTFSFGSLTSGNAQRISASVTGVDEITISVFDETGSAVDLAGNAFIKIEIY